MFPLSDNLADEVGKKLAPITSMGAFEELKASYLGSNGSLRRAMREMANLTPEERPQFGKQINHLKAIVERLFQEKLEALEALAMSHMMGEPVDISLNSRERVCGMIHPLTRIWQRLEDIFHSIGFATMDGPEIDTEWFCFDALNTPSSHPAREPLDTFFLPEDIRVRTTEKHGQEPYLLRSHTSTIQIRTMLREKPPIRIIAPGRTFRRDTMDATHSANFHQLEVLYIDEGVTICDLKSILDFFLKALFGPQTETRLRPSFFPFTEPSFEVDFRSSGLHNLNHRWIEILGCGMVHPNVLENVHIDGKRYGGFAMGLGLERLAMLFYGIDDVRLFYQNDLRFLEQF
ncbi:MAG: phenylalanine--tRNA ligase subunit alpha [Puniceicoccales bacterium]|nr:phenylalanine--tRNA ligase subunit alpha [Puniceicoccales bacterium]